MSDFRKISETALLISIRSEHVRNILSGAKTVEFRRRSPQISVPTTAVIYSSREEKSIRALVTVQSVQEHALDDLWMEFGAASAIDREYFDNYFTGCEFGYALTLGDVDELPFPVDLSTMRSELDLIPPQSWRYVGSQTVEKLHGLGWSAKA